MSTTRRAALGAALCLLLVAAASRGSSQPVPGGAPERFPGAEGPLPATLNQVAPQVQTDGAGHVYRLWMDEWAGRERHVRFQRSVDGGKTWLAEPLMLDRDKPADAASSGAAFAHDAAGRVVVVWRTRFQEGGGRKEFRFLGSADAGATWPAPAQVLSRGGGALAGEVNADGRGHVYVAWSDERPSAPGPAGRPRPREIRVFFNRSEDSGRTWLPEDIQVTGLVPEPAPSASPPAELEQEKGGKEQGRGGRRRGRQGGRQERTQAPRSIVGFGYQPRLASDPGGRVFLAWIDTRGGDAEVYCRVSEDSGKSWGPETNVSQGARGAIHHQILTDGRGRVVLLWSDRRHGLEAEDVFVSRSEDGGKSWTAPLRVSHRPAGATASGQPHMALGTDGRLYVAWADRRNGREDIYLNVSADGGKTWLERDLRLDRDDPGIGISRDPYVVTRGTGEVAVLWDDDRTGFEQILLNRSADGGRTWLARELRVDSGTGPRQRAIGPRAAWDPDGTLHVVWEVLIGAGPQADRRVAYGQIRLVP